MRGFSGKNTHTMRTKLVNLYKFDELRYPARLIALKANKMLLVDNQLNWAAELIEMAKKYRFKLHVEIDKKGNLLPITGELNYSDMTISVYEIKHDFQAPEFLEDLADAYDARYKKVVKRYTDSEGNFKRVERCTNALNQLQARYEVDILAYFAKTIREVFISLTNEKRIAQELVSRELEFTENGAEVNGLTEHHRLSVCIIANYVVAKNADGLTYRYKGRAQYIDQDTGKIDNYAHFNEDLKNHDELLEFLQSKLYTYLDKSKDQFRNITIDDYCIQSNF